MIRPPALARGILRLVVPAHRLEDALGDLEEQHARLLARAGRFGRVRAWCRSMGEAVLVAGAFAIYRRREARRQRGPRVTWSELKQGVRLVRNQPLLNLTILITLATGIGVVNIGVTLADAMLFAELPFEHGERFVRLDVNDPLTGRGETLDLARYRLLSTNASTLDFLGAKDHEQLNLFDPAGEVEQVTGVAISPGAFAWLPARPLAGRTLVAQDGAPDATPVVVIRDRLWTTRFNRRAEAIGDVLNVDGTNRVVVGVLADDFEFPNSPLVWVPLDHRYLGGTADGMSSGNELFGVRAADASIADVRREVEQLSGRHEGATPGAPRLLTVLPYTQETETVELLAILGPFVSVLVLVLLVIAFNVGNLVMVRTAARRSEIAVRTALGASRTRIVTQLFLEVAVMVGLATAIGLLVSSRGLDWFRSALTEAPYWLQLSSSPRTVAAAVVVAFMASAAAGLGPALRATRSAPGEALKGGGRGTGHLRLGRFGSAMIALQMAVSVALVGTALMTARTALALTHPDLDVPAGEVLTAQVRIDLPAPPAGLTDGIDAWQTESVLATRRAVIDAVRSIPGVTAAGAASALPGESPEPRLTWVEPADATGSVVALQAPAAGVVPGYLEAVGRRPLLGRYFEDGDLASGATLVAVVNAPLVEQVFGGRSPIGRRIALVPERGAAGAASGAAVAEPEWREIIGVVADLGLSVTDPNRAAGYYVPLGPQRQVDLAMRVEGDPMSFAGRLRAAVVAVDPTITLTRVQVLEDVAHEEAFFFSVWGGGLVLLGSAALVLSLVGMFAITALGVSERTREIGIRTALGASTRSILVLVSRQAVGRLLAGAVLGMGVGLALLRVTANLSGGLNLGSPWALVPVGLALSAAGVIACWLPARRALRLSPIDALRDA